MRKYSLAVIFLLLSAVSASAGETNLGFGMFAGLSAGAQTLDMSGINSYLSPAGVPRFDDTIPSFGAEMHMVMFDRAILGMSGALSQQRESGPDLRADMYTMQGVMEAGLVLFDIGGFRGYPILGVGWAGTSVNLAGDYTDLPLAGQAGVRYTSGRSSGGRTGTGTGMTAAPSQNDVTLSYGAVIAKASFNLDYFYPIYKSEYGAAFVFTGLRVGATGDILNQGWRLDRDRLNGSEPDFHFNSGFVRLAFGFGAGTSSDKVMKMHDHMMMMMPGHGEEHGQPPAEGDKKDGSSDEKDKSSGGHDGGGEKH